jgi:hypothetical protein
MTEYVLAGMVQKDPKLALLVVVVIVIGVLGGALLALRDWRKK